MKILATLGPGCRIICLLPFLLLYFRRAALGRRYDHADIGATRGPTTHALNPISCDGLLERLEAETRKQRQGLQGVVRVAQQQALEAYSAARAKLDFLAHMSHDLRTALNANLGFSETIRDTRLGTIGTEAYRDCARHTHESSENLLSLINNLLNMSHIEFRKIELDKGDRNVGQLVDEYLALVAGDAASNDVTLDFSAIESDIRVSGDSRAIKQVMIKLLSNAVKFTT